MLIKKVCTIGPASSSKQIIRSLLREGMTVARVNCSHGTQESIKLLITDLKDVIEKEKEYSCSIMLDLSGPKIRISDPHGKVIKIRKNDVLQFHTSGTQGDGTGFYLTSKLNTDAVKSGQKIIVGDGDACFKVIDVKDNYLEAKALNDCEVAGSKGVSFPGIDFPDLKAVTEKDKKDIEFGIRNGADLFAVSFVESAEDIREIKGILNDKNKSEIPVIAKIERHGAIRNIDQILAEADGIMIARGDLGLATDVSEVPFLQKMLINKAVKAGKPVITATQMLESMIKNPVPTRAEVNDIANSILDGTDALMLSGETAIGKFPVQSLEYMNSVIRKSESFYPYWKGVNEESFNNEKMNIEQTIGLSVCEAARAVKAEIIIAFTRSGQTAQLIARYRPKTRIYAVTPNESTINILNLVAGCTPIFYRQFEDSEKLIGSVISELKTRGDIKSGETAVISGGIPLGKKGSTNFLKIIKV